MTLILDLDLNIMKTYMGTIDEVCVSRPSKVRARIVQTDRHTHTQTDATDNITTLHSRVVTMWLATISCTITYQSQLENVAIIAMYCHLRPPDVIAFPNQHLSTLRI